MRYAHALAALVLGAGMSVASADPPVDRVSPWNQENDSGVFLDVGAGWMRADPDGMTYRAQYLRFAPQVSIHRWFYVGAAFEIGRIYSSYGTLNGMLPATCSGGPGKPCTPATTSSTRARARSWNRSCSSACAT